VVLEPLGLVGEVCADVEGHEAGGDGGFDFGVAGDGRRVGVEAAEQVGRGPGS